MEPKVSVIIPVYNAEATLDRCLQSVLAQRNASIEIVAIDDGSQDGSRHVLERYEASHPTLFRIASQPNSGAAVARNRGISLARGTYLTFLDSDDWLDEGWISEYLDAFALNPGADIVMGGYRRVRADGSLIEEFAIAPDTEWAPYVFSAGCFKMYRTKFLADHDLRFPAIRIGEDQCFTYLAARLASSIVTIPYCGYNYLFNEASASSTFMASSDAFDIRVLLETLLQQMDQRNIPLDDISKHFVIRTVVWALFFTCTADGKAKSAHNLNEYVHWLDEHIVDWRSDPLAKPSRPEGDALKNRIAVWLFVRHDRLFRIALSLMSA